MAAIERASATLRLFGDDLEPDEVTRLLGATPTSAWRRASPLPGPRAATAPATGAWLLESSLPLTAPLAEQITSLLERCAAAPATWTALAQRFAADIRCGLYLTAWNQECRLPPALLDQLAARGLALSFDLYAPVDRDQEPGVR